MSRLFLSGLAALAIGVAFASPSFASGAGETEHEVIEARLNRGECHDLMKRFDALHSKDYAALRLVHKAKVNCNETRDFSTRIGVGQMRHALAIAMEDHAKAKHKS